MEALNIDPHAHLYPSYSAQRWCEAALRNLGSGGIVVVVDRKGQDSLARLSEEVGQFATWSNLPAGLGGIIEWPDQESLVVVQGVQYVANERIEVLGLGVGRLCDDGECAENLLASIADSGGVPCLPWSPGKWLGKRGAVVRGLLERHNPRDFVVGDISVRSSLGPYSPLLARAKRLGYQVVCGTDPLPRAEDQALVGSFGMALQGAPPLAVDERVRWAITRLMTADGVEPYGSRNGPLVAFQRFLSALR